MTPLTYRPYRAGDERALVGLFDRAFGGTMTEAHWRWKLKHDTPGPENVWLALAGDRPVFQYAGIPTRFWLSGATAGCMISVDTMTAPDHRRRGLLTEVGRRAYDAWRRAGISFVLGLPNQQWGSRAAALGWRPLFPLQWLVLPLRPEAILAQRLNTPVLKRMTLPGSLWGRWRCARLRPDAGIVLEHIAAPDPRFDSLWETCRRDYPFAAIRDRRWVDWRFFAAPSRSYRVTLAGRGGHATGYCAHAVVVSRGRRIAQLAEFFTGPDDHATRATLLWNLLEELRKDGADTVVTLAAPGTAQFDWLRRAGFLARRHFEVQMVPLEDRLPMARLSNPGHWYLSGADFDVI